MGYCSKSNELLIFFSRFSRPPLICSPEKQSGRQQDDRGRLGQQSNGATPPASKFFTGTARRLKSKMKQATLNSTSSSVKNIFQCKAVSLRKVSKERWLKIHLLNQRRKCSYVNLHISPIHSKIVSTCNTSYIMCIFVRDERLTASASKRSSLDD